MLTYPAIDPVLLSLGPVKVYWYGMMYLLAFVAAFLLARQRCQREDSPIHADQIDDLIFYGAIGVVVGGRLGYVFFYGFDQFLDDPLWLFRVWDGGMSFHGGFLGVIAAMVMFSRHIKADFFRVADFIAPLAPIGLGLGRLGNFINQELWGRPTDVPWAMVFPNDPLLQPRHPSQLYQFALEGLLLFAIIYLYSRKPRPRFRLSALFLTGYGCLRFVAEFFRQPDDHIGFELFGWMTRGQELCLPMIAGGIFLWWLSSKQNKPAPVVAALPAAAEVTFAALAVEDPVVEPEVIPDAMETPVAKKPRTRSAAKPATKPVAKSPAKKTGSKTAAPKPKSKSSPKPKPKARPAAKKP